MKQEKVKYVVEHIDGSTWETMAVSAADAINHIHYKLWFEENEWTEMDDFNAAPAIPQKCIEYLGDIEKMNNSLRPAVDYLKRTWGI